MFNLESDKKQENDEETKVDDTFEMDDFEANDDIQIDDIEIDDETDLFNMDLDMEEDTDNSIVETEEQIKSDNSEESIDLFNLEDDDFDLSGIENKENNSATDTFKVEEDIDEEEKEIKQTTKMSNTNINNIITAEQKMVLFVGTTKNGTSFVVNNVALMLESMNISTAILDTTKSKNDYYIFTKNEERLRNIAQKSISNLEKGISEGIKVTKNLTVYTEMPGEGIEHEDIDNILVTLMENHDVVLIDADFETPIEYFERAQEIYLVQSMDILTIQPLTAFLRNLKSKNILRDEKIKVVINKEQKVKTLSHKLLIGGMSSYNNPSMSLMTDLFNKDIVKYCKITFEIQNYVKYLDGLVNCEISLRGYSKQLLADLKELTGMVYPLLNKGKYTPPKGEKKNRMQFSEQTNNTLDKMKKNF